MNYKEAGVDIEAADELIKAIKPITSATKRLGSIGGIGGFGAVFDPKAAGFVDPLIVTSTDGVGTKLIIALDTNKLDTIGIDLVAMCVNDLIVQGAEPLSFLDYYATGNLKPERAAKIIQGIADGCQQAGCVLAGGETAEMPLLYSTDDFDLAGFAMGAVERDNMLPKDISRGDLLIGLASTGVHSNGYSLVHAIVGDWDSIAPFSENHLSYAEEFLKPTRIYVKTIMALHKKGLLKGAAHITGGGILDNLPRILPDGLSADLIGWDVPPIFNWLKIKGSISEHDMLHTFNCGIGMVLVIEPENADEVTDIVRENGDKSFFLGLIGNDEQAVNFQTNVIWE